ALDNLAPNGVLYTGGGTHLLASPVATASKIRIRIIGEGALIKEADPSIAALMTFTSCHRIRVEDLHFVGTEDYSYFASNSPTTRRRFLVLASCNRARV